MPVVAPTVAIEGLEEVHEPPAEASASVMVLPAHTLDGPVIGELTLTVTTLTTVDVPQEVVTVYLMVSMPAATPVTTPPLTVAMAGVLLLHMPPVVASVSVMVAPAQTTEGPVMGAEYKTDAVESNEIW